MALTKEEIAHIARLARLGLQDTEVDKMAEDLSSVLEYVSELQKVDTSEVTYHYQVDNLHNVVRGVEVISCDEETRRRLLDAFPQRTDDLLKVKGVFE